MKLYKYMMGVALLTLGGVAFTACDDDDDDLDPASQLITYPGKPGDIDVNAQGFSVKSGAANRQALPVSGDYNDIRATSLNKAVATTVSEGGQIFVQGVHRGKTSIIVSTADGRYAQIPVAVYDYDNVRFAASAFTFNLMMGKSGETEIDLTEGNDDYVFTTDNPRVSAYFDEETGKVVVKATAGKDQYTATVSCVDGSDRTGSFTITVVPDLTPFSADDIAAIKALTTNEVWCDVKDPSDGNTPYYYPRYKAREGYEDCWYSQDVGDGMWRTGWWMFNGNVNWRGSYGGLTFTYPNTLAGAGSSADGYLSFSYSYYAWWPTYDYYGTVTLLEDDATRLVGTFNQTDLDNERLNRGYFVYYK